MSDLSFEGPMSILNDPNLFGYLDCLRQMQEASAAEGKGILIESWPDEDCWRLSLDPSTPANSVTKLTHSSASTSLPF